MGDPNGPKVLESVIISGDNLSDILEKIWNNAESFVKREILITQVDNNYKASWSETESPSRDDIDKFLIIQDELNNRNYIPTLIPVDALRASTNQLYNCFIHVYSTNISSQEMWTYVHDEFLVRGTGAEEDQTAARNVNDPYKEDLARLQESFNAAQSTMELLVRQMAELKLQLQAMTT